MVNEDKRIKETDAEQATNFDGITLILKVRVAYRVNRVFNALNNEIIGWIITWIIGC